MRPILLHEILANSTMLNGIGITDERIKESQSIESRPFEDGHFVTISGDEVLFSNVTSLARGPRTFTVAVHINKEKSRDYGTIDYILGIITGIYKSIENVSGSDGVRVTQVRPTGRSGNQIDEGWQTITRSATFGVLYDDLAPVA